MEVAPGIHRIEGDLGELPREVEESASVFGLAPFLHLGQGSMSLALKEGGTRTTANATRNRVRRGLVVAEVALAVMLVVGSGLMLRSFWNLMSEGRTATRGITPCSSTSGAALPPRSKWPLKIVALNGFGFAIISGSTNRSGTSVYTVSLGSAFCAARKVAVEVLTKGTYSSAEGGIEYGELNALFNN